MALGCSLPLQFTMQLGQIKYLHLWCKNHTSMRKMNWLLLSLCLHRMRHISPGLHNFPDLLLLCLICFTNVFIKSHKGPVIIYGRGRGGPGSKVGGHRKYLHPKYFPAFIGLIIQPSNQPYLIRQISLEVNQSWSPMHCIIKTQGQRTWDDGVAPSANSFAEIMVNIIMDQFWFRQLLDSSNLVENKFQESGSTLSGCALVLSFAGLQESLVMLKVSLKGKGHRSQTCALCLDLYHPRSSATIIQHLGFYAILRKLC